MSFAEPIGLDRKFRAVRDLQSLPPTRGRGVGSVTIARVKRRPNFCHPERTRISYYAAPKMTSCAAFIKESRMSFVEPIELDRKSGAVEGSAVSPTLTRATGSEAWPTPPG
jgi:hypothetical protein